MGILALVLLALVLIVLLCLLFVPIRYRFSGAFKGQLQADLRASWLLSSLSFRASYEDEALEAKLKLLGFTLWPRKEKAEAAYDRDDSSDGYETQINEEEIPERSEQTEDRERFSEVEKRQEEEERNTGTKEMPHENKAGKRRVFRLKIFQRILGRIRKIKFAILDFYDKLRHMKENGEKLIGWIQNEGNRNNIRFLAGCLKDVLTHVLPRKGRLQLTFGFEDPYSTGQVLALVSPFYPLYGRFAALNPVFDRPVLEGSGDVRGRIRLFSLLVIGLRIWRNKEAWKMIRSFRQS